MKILLRVFLLLILFLLSNSIANAEISEINIPVTSNGFLKEYWSPTMVWNAGYLSMGNDNSVYKDRRTRIMLRYDLNGIRRSEIGIGDISKIGLKLWYYHTERYSPQIYDFLIHPWIGSNPNYSSWPKAPDITEHTLERSVDITKGLKEIDITPLIKAQLRDGDLPQYIQMNLVNENQLAIWFYSSRCTKFDLHYYPQCEPHMIPSITAHYETAPPEPVRLLNPDIILDKPGSVIIEWDDDENNYYSFEISKDSEFSQIIKASSYSTENKTTFTPESEETLHYRIKNIRNLESNLIGVSQIGTISFEKHGIENAPFDPKVETPIEDTPPVNIPEKHPTNENGNREDVKGAQDIDEGFPEKPADPEKSPPKNEPTSSPPEPTCTLYENLILDNKIICEGIKIIIDKIERITPGSVKIELSLPKEIKLLKRIVHCGNYFTKMFCDRKASEIHPPIIYTATYNDKYVDIDQTLNRSKPTILIKSSQGATNGYLQISAHYFISDRFITFNSNKVKIPNFISGENAGFYRYPFSKTIGVTQWHGNTSYMKPHTGIDFGAKDDEVYALSDGKVFSTGYDNYLGECNSGGYFINLRHNDGKHSVYMHLNGDSINIRKGDEVSKGDLLATTGNSGAFNCQPLADHLHLETRNSSLQKNHTDPVPLISYNWNLVPTLGYKQYPGRLSGNNPHPGW